MTVPPSYSIVRKPAAAGQINFDADFKILEDTDLLVYLTPVGQIPDPINDKLSLNVDYTVTVLENSCSIALVVPAKLGDYVILKRAIPYSRLDDWGVNGNFSGPVMDYNEDRLTIQEEQTRSALFKQGLTYRDTDKLEDADLTFPQLGAGQFVKMNDTRSGLEAVTIEENTNCSTLRSELANELITTDGSRLVGFYDPSTGSTTVHDKLVSLESGTPPFPTSTPILKDSSDVTKLLDFDISLFTTATTRTMTIADQDIYLGDASETQKGLIEIATQVEVDAGTDDTKAVTPKTLQQHIGDKGMLIAYADTSSTGVLNGTNNLSVIKSATGTYDYTFLTPRTDTNYVVVNNINISKTFAFGFDVNINHISMTVDGFTINTEGADSGWSNEDLDHTVLVYGK